MIETGVFLVEASVASRAGRIADRYRTEDGRYILNEKDMERIRFTVDEYMTGLKGVERITHEEAKALIKNGGYELGQQTTDNEQLTTEIEIENYEHGIE